MNVKGSQVSSGNDLIIKWDDRFAIGISVIDEQHKQLVKLCADLYQCIMKGSVDGCDTCSWKGSLSDTLKKCVDYVKFHFAAEEKLMKECCYEEYAAHKKRHEDFSAKVLAMALNYNSWALKDAIFFAKYLYEWILSHIAHEDKLYVSKLKSYLLAKK